MRSLVVSLAALVSFHGSIPRSASAEPVERRIDVDGATRSYLIHVPPTWDRVRPIAVLFVWHGAGSRAEDMVRGAGFDALADAVPMLVVYPQAPAATKRFDVDPPAGRTSADVLFFDALLGRLKERFPIDLRSIWATGFSNGAALCYRLAAERPQVVAAVAPVAGYLPGLARGDPIVPVPLVHVHGTRDRRVPPPTLHGDTNAAVPTWAHRNGCTLGPVTTSLPGAAPLAVERAAYTGPTSRSDTQLWLVQGADHEWAGGPGGPISRAILEFLRAHALHEPVSAPSIPR